MREGRDACVTKRHPLLNLEALLRRAREQEEEEQHLPQNFPSLRLRCKPQTSAWGPNVLATAISTFLR